MYFETDFFVRVVRNQNQGYFSSDMLYLHIFLITMHQIDTAAEVPLEPFQTYMIEIFLRK